MNRILNQIIKPFFLKISGRKLHIQIVFAAASVLLALYSFFISSRFFALMLMISVTASLYFIFTKDLDEAEDEQEKPKRMRRHFAAFVTGIVYSFWGFTNALLFTVPYSFMKILSLMLLGNYLIFGLLIVFAKDLEGVAQFLNWTVYGDDSIMDQEEGDVIVGELVDPVSHRLLGKPLVLHYRDRFVHTLILGPTGSGKTSQILGPLSYQDIRNPDLGVIVLEPKGDFAEQVYARAILEGRHNVVYFNPVMDNCPYFNPLMAEEGSEAEMMENICSAFAAMDTTSSSYFRDQNEGLLRNSLKAVKRLYGNDATFQHVLALMNNLKGQGTKMMTELAMQKSSDPMVLKENDNIYSYFMNDYFTGLKGARGASKTYADSSAVRNQIQKLVSNPYLNRILNPLKASELKPGEYLDFDQVLENGDVLCICSAQGTLRDMGAYLGYFLILTLQSSVFKRKGDEWSRKGCILYIDEFQTYANNGFADMLTQGRSYRVASVLATQNRALINSGGDSGRQFLENVSTNCRNIILFPGMNATDAKYYENEFGTEKTEEERVSYSLRAYVPKFMSFDSARETRTREKRDKPVFSATDLQYRPFGEVVCRLIDHNSVQKPVAIKVKFVDEKIDEQAKQAVAALRSTESETDPHDSAESETASEGNTTIQAEKTVSYNSCTQLAGRDTIIDIEELIEEDEVW